MDDQVKELLDQVREGALSVRQAAGTAAWYAGRCAGEMVDAARLNFKLLDLNSTAGEQLRASGRLVYDAHVGAQTDSTAMERLLAELDETYAAIDTLKHRISILKHSKECPACGSVCDREDLFCKNCGSAL